MISKACAGFLLGFDPRLLFSPFLFLAFFFPFSPLSSALARVGLLIRAFNYAVFRRIQASLRRFLTDLSRSPFISEMRQHSLSLRSTKAHGYLFFIEDTARASVDSF